MGAGAGGGGFRVGRLRLRCLVFCAVAVGPASPLGAAPLYGSGVDVLGSAVRMPLPVRLLCSLLRRPSSSHAVAAAFGVVGFAVASRGGAVAESVARRWCWWGGG